MQMGSGGGGGGGSGGGDFMGGMSQAMASKKASEEMMKYTEAALAMWYKEKKRQREMFAPWMESGKEAHGQLWDKIQAGPGEYEESPYYNFLMEEGTKALERGAAARGMTFSGAQAKALTKYGQNVASTDYDSWLRRWYQSLAPYEDISNKGLSAVGAYSGASMNIMNNMAALAQNMGAINAGQWMNLGNIMASQQRSTGNMIQSGMGGMFGGGMGGMGGMGMSGVTNMFAPMNRGGSAATYDPYQTIGGGGGGGGGYPPIQGATNFLADAKRPFQYIPY